MSHPLFETLTCLFVKNFKFKAIYVNYVMNVRKTALLHGLEFNGLRLIIEDTNKHICFSVEMHTEMHRDAQRSTEMLRDAQRCTFRETQRQTETQRDIQRNTETHLVCFVTNIHLQTSPPILQKSYPKFRNSRTTFENAPLVRPKVS